MIIIIIIIYIYIYTLPNHVSSKPKFPPKKLTMEHHLLIHFRGTPKPWPTTPAMTPPPSSRTRPKRGGRAGRGLRCPWAVVERKGWAKPFGWGGGHQGRHGCFFGKILAKMRKSLEHHDNIVG